MALVYVPSAMAQDPLNVKAPPNTVLFTAQIIDPTATAMPQAPTVQEDINKESGWFFLGAWDRRGQLIRSGKGPNATEYCLGNLSLALRQLGSLNAAEYSGATAALSLLPTAGALIGSPTKELWIVYQLMPLAGILSVFLSLGGTMVPTDANAYNTKVSITYERQEAVKESSEKSDAQLFADSVEDRSRETRGGQYGRVWIGVGIQMVLVATILVALWYGQMGGVITWWCNVSLSWY